MGLQEYESTPVLLVVHTRVGFVMLVPTRPLSIWLILPLTLALECHPHLPLCLQAEVTPRAFA